MEGDSIATIRELITRWKFDVDLSAIERFDNRIGKLRKKVDGVGRNIQAVAQQAQAVGARMSLAITAPIVGLGFLTLRAAGNFEAGMNRVDSLVKITTVSLQELEDQARSLGETTKFSATEASDAMGFMAQAGLNSEQIFNAMPDALNLAAAANLGLAETADLVTNVMAGMGIESDQLGSAVDVLAKTFISSNTDLSQLGQAMKFAGPVAKGFGLDIQETTAILGLMGNAGIQASLAGTSLRGALTRLADPSAEAAKILGSLGVVTSDGVGGVRNLIDIMFDLEKAGATTTQIMQVFGLRAGPAMEVLISQGNESVRDFVKELRNAGGTAEEIAKKQMRGLFGAFKELRSAIEGVQIAIGKSGITDLVTKIVKSLTGFVRMLTKLNPNILRFTAILAGVIATVGPLIFILGTATLAFRSLALAAGFANVSLLTIPLIFIAIVAAIALLAEDFLVFSRGGDSLIGLIIKGFTGLGETVGEVFDFMFKDFEEFIAKITKIPKKIDDTILQVKRSLGLISDEEFLGEGIRLSPGATGTSERLRASGLSAEEVHALGGTTPEKQEDILREQAAGNAALLAGAMRISSRATLQPALSPGAGGTTKIQIDAPISVTLPEGSTAEQGKLVAESVKEALQSTLTDLQNDEPVLE